MITAADGTAFTGSVTVAVTGDGGTQATGSVGAGACTHEGNGYHSYAPAQAETNYAHVAFTFTGSGAIPATVQVYTQFPQTGDSFARIGSNGSSLSAIPWNASWDAEVQSECADALTAYDPPTRAEATSDKDEILADIATIPGGSAPTAVEIADEVATRSLLADVRKVNNIAIDGSGTSGDPWGPA